MASYARIAAVTGANKGIGLAIVRGIALQYPKSALNTGTLCIYLTARDQARGQAALDSLSNDRQLRDAKVLKADGGLVDFKFHKLNVSDTSSIDAFAEELKSQHGMIDVLVNNAGIAMDGFNNDVVMQTLQTNYHGTVHATLSFLPLLRPSSTSRVVNMASMMGSLSRYPDNLRERFLAASKETTPDAATSIMRDFEDGVRKGTHEQDGFPSAAYAVSKAGVIAATHAIARGVAASKQESGEFPLVNSCCPGWVVTDMTKGRGAKTAEQGARTPVHLALGDLSGTYGEFWQDERVKPW